MYQAFKFSVPNRAQALKRVFCIGLAGIAQVCKSKIYLSFLLFLNTHSRWMPKLIKNKIVSTTIFITLSFGKAVRFDAITVYKPFTLSADTAA